MKTTLVSAVCAVLFFLTNSLAVADQSSVAAYNSSTPTSTATAPFWFSIDRGLNQFSETAGGVTTTQAFTFGEDLQYNTVLQIFQSQIPGLYAFTLTVGNTSLTILSPSVSGNMFFVEANSPTGAIDRYTELGPGTFALGNETIATPHAVADINSPDQQVSGFNVRGVSFANQSLNFYEPIKFSGLTGNTGNDRIVGGIMSVPEPTTWAMILGSVCAMILVRARTKKSFSLQ